MFKFASCLCVLVVAACSVDDPATSATTSELDPCTNPAILAGLDNGSVRCPDNPPPDAGVMPPPSTLYAPVGAFCQTSDSYWCASYTGVCVSSVCRAQCSAVSWPRCSAGSHEVIANLGMGTQCYCTP
jgi:hypothetical protein